MTSQNGNSFLTAYLDANKNLVRGLVVKCDDAVSLINKALVRQYGESAVDELTPTSWKYYMNLAGHPHETDGPMKVISLDTHETIDFTLENLEIHTATREAYQYGSRYYYSLISKYKDQEALIRGILTPVDIDKAVAAAHGEILGWPAGLVEDQEVSLIWDLQTFIQQFLSRWNVPGFQQQHAYYTFAQWYILGVHLEGRLRNLRLKRCHTDEAHSFHIREYFASHGSIDRFLPYLSKRQTYYLYRNIRYLERNAGSTQQFQELIERILTERGIPIAEYTVAQLNTFDPNHYPEVIARRKELGSDKQDYASEYRTLEQLYEKETPLAPGNAQDLLAHQAEDTKDFQRSSSSVIQTKALESSMTDYTDAVPHPWPEVLLEQWAHMSFHGLYTAVIYFNDPFTGEPRALFAKDAFIYFNYLTLKSLGQEPVGLPLYWNMRFRREPKTSLAELMQFVPKYNYHLEAIAKDLYQKQPIINPCISISAFHKQSRAVYEEGLRHWRIIANTHDVNNAGAVRQMVLKFFGMQKLDFGQDQDYDAWRQLNNLPVYNYTREEALVLTKTIFEAATGFKLDNTQQLYYIQKNLLELFGQLSSYSIQLMQDINASTVIPLNWAAIRIGKVEEYMEGQMAVPIDVRVNDIMTQGSHGFHVKLATDYTTATLAETDHAQIHVKSRLDVDIRGGGEIFLNVLSPATRFEASYDMFDPVISAREACIGSEWYYALTEDQRQQVKSVR